MSNKSLPLPHEIIRKLHPITQGDWYWDFTTDKLTPKFPPHPSPTIWRYGPELEFSCTLWKEIMFERVLEKKAVPSHCHGCYKVIAKPRTLAELVAIEAFQQTTIGFGRSKCGLEMRTYTPRLYGAYWYCDGLDDGYIMLSRVRSIFHNIPAILKRGCTEYEMEVGPSDKWKITPEQLKLEALTTLHVDFDPYDKPDVVQSPPFVEDLHWTWIKWAYQNGDTTYLQFTNGKPLFPEYVSYEPPAAVRKGQEQLPLDFDGKEGVTK